eukprot:scaffold123287_cov30-Tisochrysis_lutea.AAC.3
MITCQRPSNPNKAQRALGERRWRCADVPSCPSLAPQRWQCRARLTWTGSRKPHSRASTGEHGRSPRG